MLVKDYFAVQKLHVSDFSVGFQYMWNNHLSPEYAFAGGCLVIREFYRGRQYFHYPVSRTGSEEEESKALEEIELFCKKRGERLYFTNVCKDRALRLVLRYGANVTLENNRKWRDYLYRTVDFQTYAGKKYAGQRNHVNKFRKLYPDWTFRKYEKEDEQTLLDFLKKYEEVQKSKKAFLAQEEMDEVYDIVPHICEFGFDCGLLFVGETLVGFSAGETCGDMKVVHIEKALREYDGAYPFLAQQFALAFCGEGIEYLNRMDDAGDLGLRKSKLQYLPCELVDKFHVMPLRAIDTVETLPSLTSERLTIHALREEDKSAYARLAADRVRNRYWGYDYAKDNPAPTEDWFFNLPKEEFEHRRELSLGIYLKEELIGEVVLHEFGYQSEVEIGVRLLPEWEGKGYAAEAVDRLTRYAFSHFGMERVLAKCYRENDRSRKLILSLGMKPCGEDETFFYFVKTPST